MRHLNHPREVERSPIGAVRDLRPAAEAIGDDQRMWRGGALTSILRASVAAAGASG
jgi:hypothetical protein